MKQIKDLSKLMLAVMAMFTMVSCGGSGDDANNGSAYTSEEIKEILTGSWIYYGNFVYKTEDGVVAGDFTGNITIKDRNLTNRKMEVNIKENTLGLDDEVAKDIPAIVFLASSYTLTKAGGNNFITFRKIPFEIVSLTKNTFVFRADDDIDISDYYSYNKENGVGHLNMTVNSK